MKKILLSLLAITAMTFVACASKEKKGAETVEAATPVLVAVFSAQGHTKSVAKKSLKQPAVTYFR